MDQFNPHNPDTQSMNPEQGEKQDALLLRMGDNEALKGLKSLDDVEATRDIVSYIASNNPIFNQNLGLMQANIGNTLVSQMSKSTEIPNKSAETDKIPNDILEYFSLDAVKIGELQTEVKEVGLDISKLLQSLQEHIENKLEGLPEKYKQKIRISIGRKTQSISDIVTEMKNESSSLDDFKNKRWILDEKIGEAYNFYTAKLFPTLQVKLALAKGKQIPEKYKEISVGNTEIKNIVYGPDGPYNLNYVNIDSFMEEIDELLNAHVDDEGNFDEGFFSTQRLLENSNENHKDLFDDMGIQTLENISLLSEKDKEIQKNAMIAYFILIGIQMVPYIGAPISLGVDGVDAFSSYDGTLELGKSLGMIDENFQMEKQWFDNVLGGVGLALTPIGLQGISRGKKLANSFISLEKVGFGKIEKVLKTFGSKLGISQEKLKGISEYLKRLFKGDIDEAKNGGKINNGTDANKIDTPNEILKELEKLGIPKEFYELVEGSGLFKTKKGKPMDIVGRFKRLRDVDKADLNGLIDKVMKEIPGLTKTEAYTIFAYTDNYLYHNLNPLLRSGAKLTPEQQKLVDTLNSGLEKMPNYTKDTILLRGDDYEGYIKKRGTKVDLDGYTSVSNNIDDTFIGEDFPGNFLIEIKGLEGRIKDISKLAFFTNFAKNIGQVATKNEGIILAGSQVKILNKEIKSQKIRGKMIDILTITVEQTNK